MTTSTILLIVVVAVAALLLIAAIAWVARNKRNQHRHVEAGKMRDRAEEQSHEVGQREALADETAAKGRVAQAEADAKAAHATGLQHQAEVRRTDAATARDDVNQEFERADTMDPDMDTNGDTPREDARTRATPGISGAGTTDVRPQIFREPSSSCAAERHRRSISSNANDVCADCARSSRPTRRHPKRVFERCAPGTCRRSRHHHRLPRHLIALGSGGGNADRPGH
jgi:FtsZ-interacting cell division protein ZipA